MVHFQGLDMSCRYNTTSYRHLVWKQRCFWPTFTLLHCKYLVHTKHSVTLLIQGHNCRILAGKTTLQWRLHCQCAAAAVTAFYSAESRQDLSLGGLAFCHSIQKVNQAIIHITYMFSNGCFDKMFTFLPN